MLSNQKAYRSVLAGLERSTLTDDIPTRLIMCSDHLKMLCESSSGVYMCRQITLMSTADSALEMCLRGE